MNLLEYPEQGVIGRCLQVLDDQEAVLVGLDETVQGLEQHRRHTLVPGHAVVLLHVLQELVHDSYQLGEEHVDHAKFLALLGRFGSTGPYFGNAHFGTIHLGIQALVDHLFQVLNGPILRVQLQLGLDAGQHILHHAQEQVLDLLDVEADHLVQQPLPGDVPELAGAFLGEGDRLFQLGASGRHFLEVDAEGLEQVPLAENVLLVHL